MSLSIGVYLGTLLHRLKSPWATALGLFVGVVCAYWAGLSGGFLFDDYPVVFKNAQVQISTLDWQSLKRAFGGFSYGELGRPLAAITFAFNHLAGGPEPWGYKLVGLLIHAFNALLVWRLVLGLLRLPGSGLEVGRQQWMAVVAASIWAVHPLQVSSVLYVVQRMEVLATTLVFISLLLYLKGRRHQLEVERGGWGWLGLAAIAAGLGMLSKETAVLAGLYALCIELTLLRFEARSVATARWLKWGFVFMVGLGAIAAIYICLKYANVENYSGRWFNVSERLLTQFRVLPAYLAQMLLPLPGGMHFYYDDIIPSRSLIEPLTTFAGAIFLAGISALAVAARRRLPMLALGISWFFAAHVLTSSPINLELMFEHRNYFALLGFVLACLAGLQFVWNVLDNRIITFIAASFVLGLGGLTVLRSATWGDPLLLAMELAQENPRSPRAATDLAEQYMLLSGMRSESPFYSMAYEEYMRAATLPQASPLPETGLMLMIGTSGNSIGSGVWKSLQHKIRHNPLGAQEKLAVESLLMQYYDGLPIDASLLDDTIALMLERFKPDPPAYSKYADFLLRSGRSQERAVDLYLKAYDASEKDTSYLKRLEQDIIGAGYPEAAYQLKKKLEARL